MCVYVCTRGQSIEVALENIEADTKKRDVLRRWLHAAAKVCVCVCVRTRALLWLHGLQCV
ncbi:MAG: hypothetical protein P4L40_08795 [Terracidiphilus sp.]|nr:hypothetical protein [Terracidiphilus sp.]